jgi:NhaP-type Na+/H+ or K+/H+ antiporter
MIDWFNLGANALWVIGCAVLLATLSYASWEARLSRQKLAERLKQGSTWLTLNLGSLLICLGAALAGGEWWWIVLWGLLGLAFLIQVVRILRAG